MSSPSPRLQDKTFEAYLAIPTKASLADHDWFPRHDVYDPSLHSFSGFYPSGLSPTLLTFDPLIVSTAGLQSSTSPPSSPERSDAELLDSSDVSSSSSSDSSSEAGTNRGSPAWKASGFHYDQSTPPLSSESVDDSPFVPPISASPAPSGHPQPSPITLPHSIYVDDINALCLSYPSPRASSRKANENLSLILDDDSDVDAEGEADDGGSEDEYIPSPRPQSRERRGHRFAHNSRSQSPSTLAASFSRPRFSPYLRPSQDILFKRTRPRHEQSSSAITIDNSSSSASRWKCPHPQCTYVQKNRRMPDFKRHLQTHTRLLEPEKWICCGVPVAEAPLEAFAKSEPTEFGGQIMVGGCWKVFSRRDALKRHLDNKNLACKGDMHGWWMPGNNH